MRNLRHCKWCTFEAYPSSLAPRHRRVEKSRSANRKTSTHVASFPGRKQTRRQRLAIFIIPHSPVSPSPKAQEGASSLLPRGKRVGSLLLRLPRLRHLRLRGPSRGSGLQGLLVLAADAIGLFARRTLVLLLGLRAQLVRQIEALGQQRNHTALAFGDIVADAEGAVFLHVVDAVQLHAVRVQFPRTVDAAVALYFDQAAFEGKELVVDWQEGFGDGFGGDDVLIDEGVGFAQEVEEGALGVEVGGLVLVVEEVAVDAGLVDAVELALVGVEVCFAQGPGLGEVHLLELVAEFVEFVVGVLEAGVDDAFPVMGDEISCCARYIRPN